MPEPVLHRKSCCVESNSYSEAILWILYPL